jgi:hypothetical protein
MKTRGMLLGLTVIGLSLVTAPLAHAQIFDHYKCYKIKDPAKFIAGVDLNAFQTQFNVDPKCKLVGRAKLFCVPVVKTVGDIVDKTKPPLVPNGFVGQDLQDDRLCYKIKCDKNQIQPEVVTDQFGTRPIKSFKAKWLCTPAFKGTPTTTMAPTTTTSTTTSTTRTTTTTMQQIDCPGVQGPECNGLCPDPAEKCTPIPGTGSCECTPTGHPCGIDADGLCSGDCPVATEVCRTFANGCDCVEYTPPCNESGAPMCSGPCEASNEICTYDDVTGVCYCDPHTDCEDPANPIGYPDCIGTCSTGGKCVADPGTQSCICG